MSPPAQKARSPAPARMMQRASASASASSKALLSALRTLVDTALTGGLFRVMVMTSPCFSSFTSFSDTGRSLLHRDLGGLDHRAPQGRLVLHPLLHVFDGAAGADEALLQQLFLHVGRRED